MSWQTDLDKQSKDQIFQRVAQRQAESQRPTYDDPIVNERVNYINNRAPWLSLNLQLALAKSYASDMAVDKAAEFGAKEAIDNPEAIVDQRRKAPDVAISPGVFGAHEKVAMGIPVDTNALKVGASEVYDTFKGLARATYALGVAIPEAAQTAASLTNYGLKRDQDRNLTLRNFSESFSLFQLLNNWDEQGSGFGLSEELMSRQAEAARATRGTINGSAFTVGRGIASAMFIPPDSDWYGGVSGFFDFMIQIAVPDPTRYIYKGAKFTSQALKARSLASKTGENFTDVLPFVQGEIPLVSEIDAKNYRSFAKAGLWNQGGGSRNLTGLTLDAQKWHNFVTSHPTAVQAIDDIAADKDILNIMQKFNWRITPEEAIALSKADTPQAVRNQLIGRYAIGGDTLDTSIYSIQPSLLHNPGQYLIQNTPLRNSRLLSQMPEREIIINGTREDRINALKNMTLSLKTSGATPEELSNFAKKNFTMFRDGATPDDQRDAYKAYQEYLKIIMGKNGVAPEAIKGIFERVNVNKDALRTMVLDKVGNETDNGFMKVYGEMLKKYFPPALWNDFMEKSAETGVNGFGMTRPMQLSQLFDRVQTLPDPRELRRLTSNPLIMEKLNMLGDMTGINKVIQAAGGKITFVNTKFDGLGQVVGAAKRTFTNKVAYVDEIEIIDEVRHSQITQELVGLNNKNLTVPERYRMNNLQDELESLEKIVPKFRHTGEASWPIEFADIIQNKIWKPLNLISIGYVIRNSIDAQMRMALGGGTGITHPGEYISLVLAETKTSGKLYSLAKKLGNTKERSILGENLIGRQPGLLRRDKTNDPEILEAFSQLRDEHRDLIQLELRKQGLSEVDASLASHKNGQWRTVSKQDNEEVWAHGALEQMRLSHSDELQRNAARNTIFGMTEDDNLADTVSLANKTQKIRNTINGIYSRGVGFRDLNGTQVFGPQVNLQNLSEAQRTEWVAGHVKSFSIQNMKTVSGNLNDTTFMIAFDRVPKSEPFAAKISTLELKYANESLKEGSYVILNNDPNDLGIVIKVVKDEATIVPVHNGSATGVNTGKPHRSAVRLVKTQPMDIPDASGATSGVGLAAKYGLEMSSPADPKARQQWANKLQAGYDKTVDKFFNELIGKRYVKSLERSPVFRKFYYDEIANQIDKLSYGDAQKLVGQLEKQAAQSGLGTDIGAYIGDTKTAEKLRAISSSSTGTITKAQLDDYARMMGINRTKALLYDASSKNNLEDVLRIVMPFASAWKDVAGRYMSFMYEDPTLAVKFNRYSNQLGRADHDNDGRGFWYKDPQSGKAYFKFPFITGFQKALGVTGVDAFFEAPVSNLSQGMSWLPALGPLGQIPASFLLQNKPDTDWLVKQLLPYGRTTVGDSVNPLPKTVQKSFEVFQSLYSNKEDDMNSLFASTYVDVLRAKFTSGDYDISTPEGLKKLKSDTKKDAQWISLLRSIQGFLGPTAPQVGYSVKPVSGLAQGRDVYVDEMANLLTKMQNENYDTATQRFLKVFGEEAALYIGSKTKSVTPGLEASREFGEWEFGNPDLLKEKPLVAAYFAPSGSEFNFDVWRRQKLEGKRVSLDDDELIALAQNRIGSSKYREARKMFGAYPTDQQRDKLAMYRKSLNAQYPGFKANVEFTVGRFENQLDDLTKLVDDERLKNNELVPPLKKYLELRQSLLNSMNVDGFKSKKAEYIRESMYSYGNQVAAQDPGFARIWQRLLSQEVED